MNKLETTQSWEGSQLLNNVKDSDKELCANHMELMKSYMESDAFKKVPQNSGVALTTVIFPVINRIYSKGESFKNKGFDAARLVSDFTSFCSENTDKYKNSELELVINFCKEY
jgi:hypothetical protein